MQPMETFRFVFDEKTLPVIPDSLSAGQVVEIVRSEGPRTAKVPLFIRQHLVDKLEEVREQLEESPTILRAYATGAPGCGKSCFFWMWATIKMQQGKRLLFVQYHDTPLIWILEDKKIKQMISPDIDTENVLVVIEQLLNRQTSKFDYAVLDGVRLNVDICNKLMTKLKSKTGRGDHKKIGKNVFVTSLQFKIPLGQEPRSQFVFNLAVDIAFDSWRETDYDNAAESEFLKNELVRKCLLDDWKILTSYVEFKDDTSASSEGKAQAAKHNESVKGDDRKIKEEDNRIREALKLKFHYSGGCARFMFEHTFEELQVLLFNFIDELNMSDWEAIASGKLAGKSATAVNSLMQRFSHERRSFCLPVSDFVLHHAYAHCRGQLNKSVKQVAILTKNPSLLGWVFELAQLNKIHDALAENQQPVVNERASWSVVQADIVPSPLGGDNMLTFCPKYSASYDGIQVEGEVRSDTVILCDKWNQGCFDVAFYVAPMLVTLQFTTAQTHSLKLKHVKDLRNLLLQSGVEIAQVVHVGVLAGDIESFSFDSPTGTGRETRQARLGFRIKVVTSSELRVMKVPTNRATSMCGIDDGQVEHCIYD